MKLVVKVGGDAVENLRARRSFAKQVAGLRESGEDVVVVHGGGKRLTRVLGELGITTDFADGLRVTNAETRDVALMVLAGIVNKKWVAEIEANGQHALGICGGDARLMTVRRLELRGRSVSLGFVGRPGKVNTDVLEMALERRWVPVVASVALGPRNEYFNVNADDFAAALALALRADRLIYLTESGGVRDGQRRLLPRVRIGEIEALIEGGIVRDGMIPKLRSSASVIEKGVGEVDIISSDSGGSLARVVGNQIRAGTRIVR